MDRYEAREVIRAMEPTFLPLANKKGYVCPICGNGTGKDGDGLVAYKNHCYKCFRCGFYGDDIQLYRYRFNIESYNKALTEVADYYGIEIDNYSKMSLEELLNMPFPASWAPKQSADVKTNDIQEKEQEVNYIEFFKKANKDLDKTDYYRGISSETLNKYMVGFVDNWKHPKASMSPASPRLIIPTSSTSYLARDVRSNLSDTQKKYCKSKVGKINIYNAKAINKSRIPIFVVEGELDALSIIDASGEAIALGSTSNVNLMVKMLKANMPDQPIIISPDNDEPGIAAMKLLESELDELKIEYYECNISGKYKDANESLMAEKTDFCNRVKFITDLVKTISNAKQALTKCVTDIEREQIQKSINDMLKLMLLEG